MEKIVFSIFRKFKTLFDGPGSLVISRIIIQGCGLVLLLVAARVLKQEDVGAFALASSFVLLATRLTDVGWAEQIAASPRNTPPPTEIFWGSLLTGFAATTIVLALLFAASFKIHEAHALQTSLILTIAILPTAFSSCQTGVIIRTNRLGSLATIQSVSEIAGLCVSIAYLVRDPTIVSLALGRLVTAMSTMVLSGMSAKWFPALRINWTILRKCYLYSLTLVTSRLISFISSYGAEFVIAAFLGLKDVGIYRVASRIAGALAEIFNEPLRISSWSAITGAHAKKDRLDAIIRAAVTLQDTAIVFGVLAFSLLALNAQEILLIILGRTDWQSAAPILAIICIARVVGLPVIISEATLTVADKSSWIPRLSTAGAFISIGLTLLAGFISSTVISIAIAQVIASLITTVGLSFMLNKAINLDTRNLYTSTFIPLVAGSISAISIISCKWALRSAGLQNQWLVLLSSVTIGLVTYTIIAKRQMLNDFRELRKITSATESR